MAIDPGQQGELTKKPQGTPAWSSSFPRSSPVKTLDALARFARPINFREFLLISTG